MPPTLVLVTRWESARPYALKELSLLMLFPNLRLIDLDRTLVPHSRHNTGDASSRAHKAGVHACIGVDSQLQQTSGATQFLA